MKIFGPARNLIRVNGHEVRLLRVHPLYGRSGPAVAVQVRLRRTDDDKQFMIEVNQDDWEKLRETVDAAFIFPEE